MHTCSSNQQTSRPPLPAPPTTYNTPLSTSIDYIMSTPLSKLDRFKLETTFGDGFVVNATINWKLSTMHKQLSTWRKQKLLGSGGFGNVWLEKDDEAGQLRAVKILERQVVVEMTFAHELLALITLAHVSNSCFCPNLQILASYGAIRLTKKNPYTAQAPFCRVLWMV